MKPKQAERLVYQELPFGTDEAGKKLVKNKCNFYKNNSCNYIKSILYLKSSKASPSKGRREMDEEIPSTNYNKQKILPKKLLEKVEIKMAKIYVANLGKYNEGHLVGEWLNLPATEEEIQELMVEIGLGTYEMNGEYSHGVIETDENGYDYHYEEYAIHDYENMPFSVGEYDSITEINEKMEELKETCWAYDDEVAESILDYYGWDDGIEILKDENFTVWHDCYDMVDVANQYVNEMGIENIHNKEYYFDMDGFIRDLDFNGFWYELEREYEEENDMEEDTYEMDYEDKEAYAQDMVDCGISDEVAERYFDYESFGRDLEYDGTWIEGNGCYIEIH